MSEFDDGSEPIVVPDVVPQSWAPQPMPVDPDHRTDAELGGWCVAALTAADTLPAPAGWTGWVFAVLDATLAAGPRAAQTEARLRGMQLPQHDPGAAWTTAGPLRLLRPRPVSPDAPPLADVVLATFGPRSAPLHLQLLGTALRPPLVTGVVAVLRGYVGSYLVDVDGAPHTPTGLATAMLWQQGGPAWPRDDTGAEAAVHAYAHGGTGRRQMLSRPATARQGGGDPMSRLTDLEARFSVGARFTDQADLWLALALDPPDGAGDADPVAALVASAARAGAGAPLLLPAAALVGRAWWNGLVQAAARQLATGTRPGDVDLDRYLVPPPELLALDSWEAVLADQRGDRVLGELLSADEVRLLDIRLVPALAAERSPRPAQSRAWLERNTSMRTVRGVLRAWRALPQLHWDADPV